MTAFNNMPILGNGMDKTWRNCSSHLLNRFMNESNQDSNLLSAVAKTYTDLLTYSDSGVITSISEQETEIQYFTTHFMRPTLFRFELKTPASKYRPELKSVLWSDSKHIRIKHSYNEEESRLESLGLGIAMLAGRSKRGSIFVPSLLMQSLEETKITEAKDFFLLPDEVIEEENCHVIQISAVKCQRLSAKVWISADSRLLKKVEHDQIAANDAKNYFEQNRFRSLAGFISWLKYGRELGEEAIKATHMIVYSQVSLNAEIPNNAFSLTGV